LPFLRPFAVKISETVFMEEVSIQAIGSICDIIIGKHIRRLYTSLEKRPRKKKQRWRVTKTSR